MWEAIRSLRVRGARAIGVAAAYGTVIGARNGADDAAAVLRAVSTATKRLRTSRPTAANPSCARSDGPGRGGDRGRAGKERRAGSRTAARRNAGDRSRGIAPCAEPSVRHGESSSVRATVLTHCNAGGLATSDYGTALAAIFAAHEQGIALWVFADETRPLLQGYAIDGLGLVRRGIPVMLICDSMAVMMREGKSPARCRRR